MDEIKTDLFPEKLREGKRNGASREEKEKSETLRNVVLPTEPLPEALRPRKDGPGGN